MDPDPMDLAGVESDAEPTDKTPSKNNLNMMVAITVALLATFMGICKIKDDNIVQAMQQAQADKIDNYTWYQARNLREEIAKSTIAQLKLQMSTVLPDARQPYEEQIAAYQAIEKDQEDKKQQQLTDANTAGKEYDELNFHDDQFDLSDAGLAIAISLLAVTALTRERWLYFLALVPTLLGVIMGLAGLLGWNLHPDFLTKLLS